MILHALPGTASSVTADYPAIPADAPLASAIDLFRIHPTLRAAAVVDRADRPIGVVTETAVRTILLNPYGHSLMQNPGFGTDLRKVMVPCATAEAAWSKEQQLQAHAAVGGEALILTDQGRYACILDANALLALVAEVEADATRARIARAERLDAAVAAYLAEAEQIAHGLHDASLAIAAMSAQLAERASATQARTAAVVTANMQTSAALHDIAERERDLVAALGTIAGDMRDARAIRVTTNRRLLDAGDRVTALADRATSIDVMLRLIGQVASRTRLLALNAAIEAARAGEAGLGFSVVATEVKTLAGQTTMTAQNISGQVDQIGDLLRSVVTDQAAIQGAVASIDQLSREIDDAVERELTMTRTISTAVEQSAEASRMIGNDAREISTDTEHLRRDTASLLDLSTSLTATAATIKQRTAAFVEAVSC